MNKWILSPVFEKISRINNEYYFGDKKVTLVPTGPQLIRFPNGRCMAYIIGDDFTIKEDIHGIEVRVPLSGLEISVD